MSGDLYAYVNVVNMAVDTSLQHMTTLTVSPCLPIYFTQAEEGKSIYFRPGKSEADDSFEVYHINSLKEIIGDAFQKLAKGIQVCSSIYIANVCLACINCKLLEHCIYS